MDDEKHYFLELTEQQMGTLKLVTEMTRNRVHRDGLPTLANFLRQINELLNLIDKAPTHITGLPGFPSRIIGTMRSVE